MRLKLKNTDLLFFLFLIILSLLYNYQEILFLGPYSNHAWRQADCLSITLNYYKESLNFFTPEVNWIGDKGNGKTISEFPIIYFTVAQIWKFFGQREFIFRLINISIVFFGLFSLRKIAYEILGDKFWSIYIPLFLFTSPLLIFYTNNFLPNAPAFGMALAATYFYSRYYHNGNKKMLFLSMFLFSIAGLLKITALTLFMSIFSITFFYGIWLLIKRKTLVKSIVIKLLPFVVVLAIILLWYLYARYYNSHNHENIFLQRIFPIWQLTSEERGKTLEMFYWNLIPSFFNKEVLLGISFIFLFTMAVLKKTNIKVGAVLAVTFIGIILYSLLFFKAFDVHDYYLTNLLIFIPLTLIAFLSYLKLNHKKVFKNLFVKAFFIVILLGLITQGALKNRLKYDSRKYLGKSKELFIKKSEQDYWDYVHWSYGNNFKAFETVKSYLRTLGIKREDKVLCLSDASINISLYLMDQKGLTRYGYANFSDDERIEFAIAQGCKYLIVTEQDLKTIDIDDKYLERKTGQYENINIFKLEK